MMIAAEEALTIILNSVEPLGSEQASLAEAPGRVLASDIISTKAIPPFDNSAMDGFALLSESTAGASAGNRVCLQIRGEVQAGSTPLQVKVTPESVIRIMTGARIPAGADAVIPLEEVEEKDGCIFLGKPVRRSENIRFAGEDIAVGSQVLQKGTRLRSAAVGLLASLDYSEIPVYRLPAVAILATGDEIIEVGEPGDLGSIRNSNSYSLRSEMARYNARVRYLGIAKDTRQDLAERISQGLTSDLIVSTGGVSMGKYDFIKEVIRELGFEILIEKVRMKPGKPFVFAKKGNVLFFGLPGNPVSTMVSFMQFIRPALLRLMGAARIQKPLVRATVTEEIRKKPDRVHYIRGYFTVRDGLFQVSTTGPQGSGILRSMSEANCLIIIPEGVSRVQAGDQVMIQLIEHEEIE